MKFAEIRKKIVNNLGFETLDEIKKAGYCIVKERDGERYFLAKPEELKPILVRLGEIAEVRFGIKTGANDFFYLEPVGKTVKEVVELARKDPKAPVLIKNGTDWVGEIEAKFLRPLLFSLKEAPTVRPDLKYLRRCVFVCSESIQNLHKQGYKHAVAYIKKFAEYKVRLKHGGECSLPEVPSLRGRVPWYSLPSQNSPDFIVNRFVGERFVFLEGGDLLVCDVFFVGYLHSTNQKTILAAVLNSTLSVLIADVLGRKTYGIGVVYLYGPEINSLLTLNVLGPVLSQKQHQLLLYVFERMSQRSIQSIFEELGYKLCRQRGCLHPEHPYEYVNPKELTLDQVKKASPDRFELDRVVFDILGLTIKERIEVYRAVVQLVKERLVKARSV